jgi:hypothetical protein
LGGRVARWSGVMLRYSVVVKNRSDLKFFSVSKVFRIGSLLAHGL